MLRIPTRFSPLFTPASAGGATLTKAELNTAATSAPVDELRRLGAQAVDAVENGEALNVLATRLGGADQVKAPISSLEDFASGRAWLNGDIALNRTGTGQVQTAIKLVQRALMKVGAHHVEGRKFPELLLMPWGADGAMGNATIRALNKAMEVAGRPDLANQTLDTDVPPEVGRVLNQLLADTPRIRLPSTPAHPGTVTPPPPARPTLPNASVFNATAIPVATTGLDPKWTGVLARMDAEKDGYFRSNPDLDPGARHWLTELETARGKPEMFQLNRVNSIINQWSWESDATNYGVTDYWASPLEFFARRGDCEDFVMAKWASLVLLGFPEERLRMVVVSDRDQGVAHAVLAVDMPDGTYILDNQAALVLKDTAIRSLNHDGQRYVARAALAREGRWIYPAPQTPA